ncbi:MAG: ATP-dependent helicase, partial [Lachnospiraceae bacterium]|nr:ATP-dependent helicase [Lachnospiraceae bacterium]
MNIRHQSDGSQTAAACHNKGPMMVLAGPGSGKTFVIVNRIENLIKNCGAEPEKILVITFTRAAATQMRERFEARCGKSLAVNFGTFHAVFFKILRYAYNYKASSILADEEKFALVDDIVKGLSPDRNEDSDLVRDVSSEIGKIKCDGIDVEHYFSVNLKEDEFRKVYSEYNRRVRAMGKIDFDDMVLYCRDLLAARKDILEFWQSRYEYILIDEFQDINRLQYETIKLIAGERDNLFIVGDDDQSIYHFRGASPSFMLNFEREHEGCKRVVLDRNYRSGSRILGAASKLIAHNKNRFDKELKAARDGGEVFIREYSDLRTQNEAIVRDVIRQHDLGLPYDRMAVLYRTNMQPGALAEKLMEYNVPFRMKDGMKGVFSHWIAMNFFDYINIARGEGDRKAALRIINRPARYIKRESLAGNRVTLEGLRKMYAEKPYVVEKLDKLKYDLIVLKKLGPLSAIRYIRRAVGYDDYLGEYAGKRGIDKDELLKIADEIEQSAEGFDSVEEWFEHIEDCKTKLGEAMQEADGEDRLWLMT